MTATDTRSGFLFLALWLVVVWAIFFDLGLRAAALALIASTFAVISVVNFSERP